MKATPSLGIQNHFNSVQINLNLPENSSMSRKHFIHHEFIQRGLNLKKLRFER